MEISEKNIKVWSTIGSRATFGLVALELVKKIENLIILTSDVSTSAGLDRYRKTYPDKYIDTGIAEQNLIGIAAGLASENYNVITTTFAPSSAISSATAFPIPLPAPVTMATLPSNLFIIFSFFSILIQKF